MFVINCEHRRSLEYDKGNTFSFSVAILRSDIFVSCGALPMLEAVNKPESQYINLSVSHEISLHSYLVGLSAPLPRPGHSFQYNRYPSLYDLEVFFSLCSYHPILALPRYCGTTSSAWLYDRADALRSFLDIVQDTVQVPASSLELIFCVSLCRTIRSHKSDIAVVFRKKVRNMQKRRGTIHLNTTWTRWTLRTS